jgi:hypothetical protein
MAGAGGAAEGAAAGALARAVERAGTFVAREAGREDEVGLEAKDGRCGRRARFFIGAL